MLGFLLGFLGLGAAAAAAGGSSGSDDRAPDVVEKEHDNHDDAGDAVNRAEGAKAATGGSGGSDDQTPDVIFKPAPLKDTGGQQDVVEKAHGHPDDNGDSVSAGGGGDAANAGTPVYFILGQSNAQLLYNSQAVQGSLEDMGIEANVVRIAAGGKSVVKPDGAWNVITGDGADEPGWLYSEFLKSVDGLRADVPDMYIAGAIWVQGEADAYGVGPYYESARALFEAMHENTGEAFPIAVVGLSDYQNLRDIPREHVQNEQMQLSEDLDYVTFVDTDAIIAENNLDESFVMRDGLHYNREFFEFVGEAAVQNLLEMAPQDHSTHTPTERDDMGHGGHDDDMSHGGHDGGMDHGGHEQPVPIALPTTQAEINAFVAAVRASPEAHAHHDNPSKAGEHMAAMDLAARDEATHIAIAHGDWDDPSTWHNGEVPGDDARALIPEGVKVTYDHVSDARLFTVRVDGELKFATDVDSQMVVDTFLISPSGTLEIGTKANPVDADVNVDIIFANNGAIDTDWDPMLLSRGMIAHGKVSIHGTEKDSHDKVVDSPMAGDTWVDMGQTPEGWAVGDTIVIAGAHYEGYTIPHDTSAGYTPPQDEIRIISQIKDGMIFFEEPLVYDHDSPREDLMISVANYTRNVSFETEDAANAEIFERGHVMFMHSDNVDVRYAEFHELGRTDKSDTALETSEFRDIDFDSNVKGRYSFHFHRTGLDDQDDPAISIGNAVYGSPGWGFVHHESNALLENNASYDTFGAGYVAENGTETGAWIDNIAIFAQGVNWRDPKLGNDSSNFDMGKTGDGFWFQGRMVSSVDNVAASVNNGFVYFHRGDPPEGQLDTFDAAVTDIPGIFQYHDSVDLQDHPILGFSGNEVFASKTGMYVAKANTLQGHDVHTVLEDFTAWNVQGGADLSYTAHYTLKDFDVIAEENVAKWNVNPFGISLGSNTSDIAIVDATIEGFSRGINLNHKFTNASVDPEENEFTIVNPTFIDNKNNFEGFNPQLDTLISSAEIPYLTPDIELDGPLTYSNDWRDAGGRKIEISGTKTDSLGETDFPTGWDDYTIRLKPAVDFLESKGYYTTSEGQDYAMLDIFFSDRLSGDIYMERHPVFLDDNLGLGDNPNELYEDVPFNGVQDLGGADDPTIDSAILWATLTEGQVVLSEEAQALEEENHAHFEDDML